MVNSGVLDLVYRVAVIYSIYTTNVYIWLLSGLSIAVRQVNTWDMCLGVEK